MRNAGRLKLGYYPLPAIEGQRLRDLLQSDSTFNAIDPCVGTGDALRLITRNLDCRLHGIELDAERAGTASRAGIATIQGNVFEAHAKVETFSLLYLNPPYDSEIGSLNNQRMELLFLEHTYRWLVQAGVLMFVVPEKRLSVCIPLLAANFTDFRIFRLKDPESIRFEQVVLTAVRKSMRGDAMETNRRLLQRMLFNIPLLDLEGELEPYSVPATPPAGIVYRGLPFDEIEDLIPHSPAWKQVASFLLPREEMASGRPITPLHAGHVGLLCTAGLLNGVFGDGAERHIARWRSVKHTTIIKEKEDDVEIVRKRERFSNELCLVYQDGRTLVLTESAKKTEEEDAECTSEAGAA
jgi:Uncharacterised methyltransferase family (DUF6094)